MLSGTLPLFFWFPINTACHLPFLPSFLALKTHTCLPFQSFWQAWGSKRRAGGCQQDPPPAVDCAEKVQEKQVGPVGSRPLSGYVPSEWLARALPGQFAQSWVICACSMHRPSRRKGSETTTPHLVGQGNCCPCERPSAPHGQLVCSQAVLSVLCFSQR